MNEGIVKQKGESYKHFIRKDTEGNSKPLIIQASTNFYYEVMI